VHTVLLSLLISTGRSGPEDDEADTAQEEVDTEVPRDQEMMREAGSDIALGCS
jgi:hypothetical protein